MTLVPLFPLGSLLVPGQVLNLNLFEPRYLQLAEDLLATSPEERAFGVVAIQAGHEVGHRAAVSTASVGTMAYVRQLSPAPGGRVLLIAVGRRRFRLRRRIAGAVEGVATPTDGVLYDRAEVELLPETKVPADQVEDGLNALGDRAVAHLCLLLETLGRPIPQLPELPDALSFAILLAAPLPLAEQVRLLAIDDTAERLSAEIAALRRERHLLQQLRAAPHQGPIDVPPPN